MPVSVRSGRLLLSDLEADLVFTETVVNVATTSTAVLAANAQRVWWRVQNDSDTTVYLTLGGGAATVNAGVRLNPNGGADESAQGDNRARRAINAIHGGAGTKRLLVTQVTRV